MPNIPFTPSIHQKVRYNGNRYIRFKQKLFVVHTNDCDLDKAQDQDFIIIHPFHLGIVTYNKSDTSQQIYIARKSDLTKVGAEVNE